MANSKSDLTKIYDSLNDAAQNELLTYAEFLVTKSGTGIQTITEPLDIPRPEDESVVGAIKRLKKTYPMIESMKVFAKASNLMSDHMVNGKGATEVIDEIELVFKEAFSEVANDSK